MKWVLGIGLWVAIAATAPVHLALHSSVPAHQSRIAAPPKELRLTFTEDVELALTRVTLRGERGDTVSIGKLALAAGDSATVIAPVAGRLTSQTYTVGWEATGFDGHPADGTFSFALVGEVGVGDRTVSGAGDSVGHHPASTPTRGSGFDAQSFGYVVIRFLFFAALLAVVGAVAFRFLVLRELQRRTELGTFVSDAQHRAAVIGRSAAGILLAAVVLRLVAQMTAVYGWDGALQTANLRVLLTATAWGTVWVVQLSASAIALLGLDVARRAGSTGPRGPFGWITAAVAAGVLSATPALAGHAASAPVLRPAPVFLDTLHVIGAAGWMGSLLLVVLAGLPAALSREKRVRGKAVADLITAFSPTALVFAGLVGATGLFAAWLHLGSPGALWESDYGRVLLAKLLAVAAVVAIGAYNWLRMKPRLGTVEAGASVRRSAMVELTMATIVLLFTAILVATPPSIGGK